MWLGIVTWIGNMKLHLWFVFVQQSSERDVVFSVANEQVNISKRHAPVSVGLRDGKTFHILDNAIENRVFWSAWLDGPLHSCFWRGAREEVERAGSGRSGGCAGSGLRQTHKPPSDLRRRDESMRAIRHRRGSSAGRNALVLSSGTAWDFQPSALGTF